MPFSAIWLHIPSRRAYLWCRKGVRAPNPGTWFEKMLESGLRTLGVHTHSYRDLRHLEPSEVEEEVSTSNELIAKRIGAKSRSFAYRWGYWSAVVEPLLPERYATAVLGGSPDPERRPSPNRLHRYPVQLSGGVALFKRLEE